MFAHWNRLFSARPRHEARPDPARKPRLLPELLEDRTTPATFLVASTADSGPGSLRQAVLSANATPGPDAITFAIGSGVQTITPATPLPAITDAVSIDGTTQPGYAGTPIIELDGIQPGTDSYGVVLVAGNSSVRGLAVIRFGKGGILVDGPAATGNVIAGNYVGLAPDGVTPRGNARNGLDFQIIGGVFLVLDGGAGVWVRNGAHANTIGGTTAADRNVISGNGHGLVITEAGTDNNSVVGNYIGTDAVGSTAVGNRTRGDYLMNGPNGTVLGGNVIAGNGWSDVWVGDTGWQPPSNTRIRANKIGTDATGTVPVSTPQFSTVLLANAAGTVVA